MRLAIARELEFRDVPWSGCEWVALWTTGWWCWVASGLDLALRVGQSPEWDGTVP